MENPAPSIVVTDPMAAPVPAEFTKLTFRTLYMRRSGPGSRETTVPGRPSDQLGKRLVTDCPVYDGRGCDASLARGSHSGSHGPCWLRTRIVDHMVFETDDRLKGSTLVINGMVSDGCDEWAIYGGTRVFAMATGVIKRKNLAGCNDGNSDELTLEVFCPVFGSSQQPKGQQCCCSVVTKVGLWGGPGGWAQDITEEPPNRLHSLTVRAGDAIDAIEFTYTDSAGHRRTAGLGGNAGTTINLGDTEYVKEVSGTYGTFEGVTTLTSFRLVTSARSWGPWGIENGTRFCITAPIGSSIVGLYGRAGSRLVDAIGVYLRQL